jgi:transcription antitermination factor NusG
MGMAKDEVQAKGMENIFNKIIAENFPNLGKEIVIQVQEVLEHQTDKTRKNFLHHIMVKMLSSVSFL